MALSSCYLRGNSPKDTSVSHICLSLPDTPPTLYLELTGKSSYLKIITLTNPDPGIAMLFLHSLGSHKPHDFYPPDVFNYVRMTWALNKCLSPDICWLVWFLFGWLLWFVCLFDLFFWIRVSYVAQAGQQTYSNPPALGSKFWDYRYVPLWWWFQVCCSDRWGDYSLRIRLVA